MKLAGVSVLTLSGILVGLTLCADIKRKIKICNQLIKLCEMLLVEFSFRQPPIIEAVKNIIKRCSLDSISFIDDEYFYSVKVTDTPLSKDENNELAIFIHSLGKSDLKSQVNIVNSFCEYIKEVKTKYSDMYASKSKVYLAMGFSLGLVLSLILV